MRARCPTCGYVWNYKGKATRATCPRCYHKLTVDKNTLSTFKDILLDIVERNYDKDGEIVVRVVENTVTVSFGEDEISVTIGSEKLIREILLNTINELMELQRVESPPPNAIPEIVDHIQGYEFYYTNHRRYALYRFFMVETEEGVEVRIPYYVPLQKIEEGGSTNG